jgi:hypothetical protein
MEKISNKVYSFEDIVNSLPDRQNFFNLIEDCYKNNKYNLIDGTLYPEIIKHYNDISIFSFLYLIIFHLMMVEHKSFDKIKQDPFYISLYNNTFSKINKEVLFFTIITSIEYGPMSFIEHFNEYLVVLDNNEQIISQYKVLHDFLLKDLFGLIKVDELNHCIELNDEYRFIRNLDDMLIKTFDKTDGTVLEYNRINLLYHFFETILRNSNVKQLNKLSDNDILGFITTIIKHKMKVEHIIDCEWKKFILEILEHYILDRVNNDMVLNILRDFLNNLSEETQQLYMRKINIYKFYLKYYNTTILGPSSVDLLQINNKTVVLFGDVHKSPENIGNNSHNIEVFLDEYFKLSNVCSDLFLETMFGNTIIPKNLRSVTKKSDYYQGVEKNIMENQDLEYLGLEKTGVLFKQYMYYDRDPSIYNKYNNHLRVHNIEIRHSTVKTMKQYDLILNQSIFMLPLFYIWTNNYDDKEIPLFFVFSNEMLLTKKEIEETYTQTLCEYFQKLTLLKDIFINILNGDMENLSKNVLLLHDSFINMKQQEGYQPNEFKHFENEYSAENLLKNSFFPKINKQISGERFKMIYDYMITVFDNMIGNSITSLSEIINSEIKSNGQMSHNVMLLINNIIVNFNALIFDVYSVGRMFKIIDKNISPSLIVVYAGMQHTENFKSFIKTCIAKENGLDNKKQIMNFNDFLSRSENISKTSEAKIYFKQNKYIIDNNILQSMVKLLFLENQQCEIKLNPFVDKETFENKYLKYKNKYINLKNRYTT